MNEDYNVKPLSQIVVVSTPDPQENFFTKKWLESQEKDKEFNKNCNRFRRLYNSKEFQKASLHEKAVMISNFRAGL